MLKGIIFVREGIISLDLKRILSQYYKIVNVFKNAEDAPLNVSGIDFLIIDSDLYSDQELRSILKKMNLDPNVNIIKITSNPPDLEMRAVEADRYTWPRIKTITKPYYEKQILNALQEYPNSHTV